MVNGSYEKKYPDFQRIICIDNKSDFDSIFNEINSQDLILATDQDIIDLCNESNIQSVDIKKIFHPYEFSDDYESLTEVVSEIEKKIKNCFKRNYKVGSGELFEWFNYPLKILIEQIIFNKRLIEKSLSFYSVNKVVIRKGVNLEFTEQLLVDKNVSLLSLVAKDIAENSEVIIDKSYDNNYVHRENISYFSFGQYDSLYKFIIHLPIFRSQMLKLRSFLRYSSFIFSLVLFKIFFSKKKYFLSVGCMEIDNLASNIERHGVPVVKLNSGFHFDINAQKSEELGNKIIDDDFYYDNFNFHKYLVRYSGLIALNTVKLLRTRQIALKLLTQNKPKCIFVQTLSSFNVNSMVINSVASEINIDVYCWMHGGYGGYCSLPGFDITDFRFTKNHICYGDAAKDSISDKNSILKIIHPKVDFNVIVLGSPLIESLYSSKKIFKKNKKQIVFSLPGVFLQNNYYLGYKRPNDFLNWWDEIQKIITALSEHDNNFDIVIKDYAFSPQKNIIERFLKKLGNNKVEYISSELSYLDAILDADILIYPWVSTSLMEGFQTNADILLFDNSDMFPQSKIILSKLSVFETNIDKFISELHNYLNNFDLSTENNFVNSNINVVKDYYIKSVPVNSVVKELINLSNK
jgi:hypothetical protein